MLALGLLGGGVEGRLTPMTLETPGSPSARAESVLRASFGNTIPLAILLRGPVAELQRQGRALTERLRAVDGAQTLSPWDRAAPGSELAAPAGERQTLTARRQTAAGTPRTPARTTRTIAARGDPPTALASLRPRPRAALLLLTYHRPGSAAAATVASTEALLARTIEPPVHSYLTGVAVIGEAIQTQTLKDTETAEMIALPVLVIVLLIVFRSPIAAAVPLAMGGATLFAGRGLLWLASFATPVNSLGVAIAAMMSLALGVDYALLMVSRVRQEIRGGRARQQAVAIASRSAGRTILAAGGTLALVMLAASFVATPGLLGPVAIGVVISGLLSVALARTVMPALLMLLGPSLDRFTIRLPRRRASGRPGRLRSLGGRLAARPAILAALILLGMLVLAAPALTLKMVAPAATELPASSPARQAVRELERTIGTGWSAPFVIVARAGEGPITQQARLRALIRWQARTASEPDVAAVLGPGSVAGANAMLTKASSALRSAPKRIAGAQHGIASLRTGLAKAGAGVDALRRGLGAAASGAGSLGAGARHARHGAAQLGGEAGRASGGARTLATETGRARAGAQRLAGAASRARAGARRLARGSGSARDGARKLAAATDRASQGAQTLRTGLGETAAGSQRLAAGLSEAAAGAQRLEGGDRSLGAGTRQLAAGMDALDSAVKAAVAPIEAIAAQLREYAGWIEALERSRAQLQQLLAGAMQAAHGLPVAHEDPRYESLLADLHEVLANVEREHLAGLARIESALRTGLQALSTLPTQLAELTESLDQLTAGADRLASGATESEEGASELDAALHSLAAGGQALSEGLGRLRGGAGELANGLTRLEGGEGWLAHGLGRLDRGNRRLARGLGRLAGANGRLANGLGSLQHGDERLANGLGALHGGGERLANGLGSLQHGNERLERGLAGAGAKTEGLSAGLGAARRPLHRYASMLAGYERDYALLHADSPQVLQSGDLVLAALAGAVPPLREQVAQLVDVSTGGQTARMIVVPDSAPGSAATAALSARLRGELPALARATGANVQIGQGAQYLLDYENANTARLPWLILALAAVATLTLIVVLRALLLPLIAVLLNLATIFVALGALVLLTREHVLGGAGSPSYIDAASGAGIIAIMFVLSIDYEVFLLMRMRERWEQSRDANAAIAHGLRHTTSVIAGSAAIMTAVFLAFAGAAVIPLQQFGVGLTIAVLLDATIVRLVLLPAVMRVVGPRIWWMPPALSRRLPRIE